MKIQFYCKALLCSSALLGTIVVGQADPILWTGPAIFFTDPAGGDPSLAVNQDRITPDIWITRGSFQGIYNAESEGGFTHFFSPQGTEWANGTLANYSSLTYTDWNTWAKNVNGGPPSTVGVSAVMHIIPDDIYISVEFTSWGGSEGGFSYMRSTPATVPEPSAVMLLAVGLALCSVRVLRPKNCSQG